MSKYIETVVTAANVTELAKKTLSKVGFVFAQPLPEAVQEEKIAKAITSKLVKEGTAQ